MDGQGMMDEKYHVFFTATSHDALLAMVASFGGTATIIDMQGNRASSSMYISGVNASWVDEDAIGKEIVFYGPMIIETKYRAMLPDAVVIIKATTRDDIMRVHGLEYTPL